MEHMSISIGDNQTIIRKGIACIATVSGNCDHVKLATLMASAPDLQLACKKAFEALNKVDLDIETPLTKELCRAYDLLWQALKRSKDLTIESILRD